MASWLPETLFEIVGQGPAPSKDYYQLLITRSQASASRGFPSLLTPFPARLGPAMRAAPGTQPPWPAGSAASRLTARDLPWSLRLGGPRVGSLPEPGSTLASLPCLPPNAGRFPSYLPASYPLRSLRAPEEKQASLLACLLTSAWEGGKERLSQVSQGGAGRGRKGRSLPGYDLILGEFIYLFILKNLEVAFTITTSEFLFLTGMAD